MGAVLIAGLGAASCALPYYTQAIRGQVGLLRQRVPIENVIADASYDATTRAHLELVLEIRRFAVGELGLPDNRSYSSYVDLGRDYVVWNVIAAPEFSVEPRTWCFPVAGCVSYRGYFDRAKAEAYAAKLEDKGYDTFTGGSPAYSTLGHFSDPVLNTMLTRGETNISATLFHELAHQRLYTKGDTDLSESFATAVEHYAVEGWLESRNELEALAVYRASLERQRDFADLVQRQRERLAAAFASARNETAKRHAKAHAFVLMREEYAALKADWGGRADYDAWFDGDLNNAHLIAVTSYQRWVAALSSRLETLGPRSFYEEVEALLELDDDERAATLARWNEASVTAAVADRSQLVDAALQVGTDDGVHALRLDTEGGEAVLAANARDGQRAIIVPAEGLAGKKIFSDPCLEAPERTRKPDDRAANAELTADEAQDFLECVNVRPAKLVGPAEAVAVRQRADESIGHVADIDRRESRLEPREREDGT
jgi:predicted aminopeptidase